jgi:hypothetical protein
MLVAGQPPTTSRAVIDACRPYERLATFPPVAQGDPAYLAEIRGRFGHLID